MEGSNVGKTSWEMTQEAFDLLMSRLDSDPEEAGLKYEDMRLMLIKFLENRNILAAGDHADEVINRVARKLIGGEDIRSLTAYALGVIRLYVKEIPRRVRDVPIEEGDRSSLLVHNPVELEMDDDRRDECCEQCLSTLSIDERDMILQYYAEEKQAKIDHRKLLARKLGLTTSTLRTRACRVRLRLEECIKQCVAGSDTEI